MVGVYYWLSELLRGGKSLFCVLEKASSSYWDCISYKISERVFGKECESWLHGDSAEKSCGKVFDQRGNAIRYISKLIDDQIPLRGDGKGTEETQRLDSTLFSTGAADHPFLKNLHHPGVLTETSGRMHMKSSDVCSWFWSVFWEGHNWALS